MAYQVRYTETTNLAKPAITVEDKTVNNQTSLVFPGKNYAGYGPTIAENLLHLLENFAKNTAPANAVEGQLWYDNTPSINLLKVFDGSTWSPAGSIKKSSDRPKVAVNGDLWVNTVTNQLNIFSGSTWSLVGPQYGSGAKTGPDVETIIDILDVSHTVSTIYSNNTRVMIISAEAFTPKAIILGFSKINRGINLTTINNSSTVSGSTVIDTTKLWGTAAIAESLLVNGSSVVASNFIRNDIASSTSFPFDVKSNGGIRIGADLTYGVAITNSAVDISSKDKSINFTIISSNSASTVLHISSTESRVGIGPNNTAPSEVLDVKGNIKATGTIKNTSDTTSTSITTGSIVTAGGIGVAKDSTFGGSSTFFGQIKINNVNQSNAPVAGTVLTPGYPTSLPAEPLYDIGSASSMFRNIYSKTFTGDLIGKVTGNVTGNASGTAGSLANTTNFSMTGDVSCVAVGFNGVATDNKIVFATTISQDFIKNKTSVSTLQDTDEILLYRSNTGLLKTSKQSLLSSVPLIPVGTIFPYAGVITDPKTQLPSGYLLCDGSEVSVITYSALFHVVGYHYRDTTSLVGQNTFALPDLRGRFPLGRDNMDNNLEVVSKTSTPSNPIKVNAGGNRNGSNASNLPANRVTDYSADQEGGNSGNQEYSVNVTNLPAHSHSLTDDITQFYAGSLPGVNAASSTEPGAGFSVGDNSTKGVGLSRTGNVQSINEIGQKLLVINPYQTINYIIFTGAL